MNEIESINNDNDLLFNEVLFGLAIVAFLILLVIEKIKPYRHFSPKINKESFVTNTTAFLVNNLILTVLRASSLFLVAQQFASYGLLGHLENGPVKWLLAFIFFDLAIYAWHVASHKFEFLWRFHKIHHSDKSFNVSTGFRFHVFDLLLEIVYKSIFVVVIGVNAYLVLSIEIIELFFIFFHHANLRVPNEESISQVFITPSLHRTHHSTLRKEHDSNYGIVLSFWDRIFCTRKELVPEHIGLDLIEAENFIQLFSLAFITEIKIRKLFSWIPKGKKRK
ncbi:sterol desaturase family protein [Candidatus Methylobacter oryzae]|uniref:Sterol desaturase family protein n=1 Tax=Candidatus Methylobacter oryzae TaxID=2497749 RepID=A0ABY3CC15_9GAMM|nr:sterol desaturase family protein [Candidatus Methylobacter oryzae]TRW97948.1 sterol desaturase family protein [Candidatus Methylobacter oryzae]